MQHIIRDIPDVGFSTSLRAIQSIAEITDAEVAVAETYPSRLSQDMNNLTYDEIAAIHLYTMQTHVFSTINFLLRACQSDDKKESRSAMTEIAPYLPIVKLMLSGLSRLPKPRQHLTVYRGERRDYSSVLKVGNQFMWPSFVSTSHRASILVQPFSGSCANRLLHWIFISSWYFHVLHVSGWKRVHNRTMYCVSCYRCCW